MRGNILRMAIAIARSFKLEIGPTIAHPLKPEPGPTIAPEPRRKGPPRRTAHTHSGVAAVKRVARKKRRRLRARRAGRGS